MPTFWRVALRPKWLGALAAFLALAGVFAFLGQWQFERSIDASRTEWEDTEQAVPLSDLAEPQQTVDSLSAWRIVEAEVRIVPGDTVVLSSRLNHGDETGYWVVGHGVVTAGPASGASLAVAAGWTPDAAEAERVAAEWVGDQGTITGRYLPSESPQQSDFEDGVRSALATSELVNLWTDVTTSYGGYVALSQAPAPLETIDAPAPSTDVEVNLLNLFYALEWVFFAGAAIFLWWRLVRDEQLAAGEEAQAGPAQG